MAPAPPSVTASPVAPAPWPPAERRISERWDIPGSPCVPAHPVGS